MSHPQREIRNSKVFRDYFVGDTYEAGLVLVGTEVKSIRDGKAQINDAFVRIGKGGEAFLYHAHIQAYEFGNLNNHNPTRPRKLLLHRKELTRLEKLLGTTGQNLIPLKLYFKKGRLKVAIALCKGKKLYDKRQDIKKKDQMMEAKKAMSHRRM